MKIKLNELMETSGVKFGTSGARGLVSDMTDFICCAYTKGFLLYLEGNGELKTSGQRVAIAGDLRFSTKRIMAAVQMAINDMGYITINCGSIPSPAVALYGIKEQIPSIMVTGSHIPDDRNGIKFNKSAGEIMKYDETGIKNQVVDMDRTLFNDNGMIKSLVTLVPETEEARLLYLNRYTETFPKDCLKGYKVGFYQHSAVGREIIASILEKLGANVTKLGYSDTFIPVDTEAIRIEDVMMAKDWCKQNKFDAILSTDGDSDRPLISDEKGEWLRGDIAGILCSRYLKADSVSLPVSCNSAVEKCACFESVQRTRIGSPYVIDSMYKELDNGRSRVVGYEANGGFLTASDINIGNNILAALPTRDALLLHLGVLLLAGRENLTVSELVKTLPLRFTTSDRLQNFPVEKSRKIIEMFSSGNDEKDKTRIDRLFASYFKCPISIDRTDGIRICFENNEIIHLRPSGNAPEFRCYVEADSPQRAKEMSNISMNILKTL